MSEISDNFEELYIRTSDLKSSEIYHLENTPEKKEKNPFMGLHGIRYGLKYPDILKSELYAIKRIAKENKTVGIILPQITSVKEFKKVKEYTKELEMDNIKVGIMIETPAAVQLIKDFAEEQIDFILIETDDLMQSLLVLDKTNPETKEFFEETHPALIYQLEYIIRVCKRRNIETTLSGNITQNDEILKLLIQKGISSIVIPPEQAKETSEKI